MKGITLIAATLVVLFIGIFSILIVSFFFKYHLWYTIEYTYQSATEDLVLLSLLNTECSGKKVYEIISMSSINDFSISDSDLSCIEDKLDKLSASNCYRIFIEKSDSAEKDIIHKGSCPLKREVCYRIALPYGNDLVSNICLVLGD